MRSLFLILFTMLIVNGCGGSGSSTNNSGVINTPIQEVDNESNESKIDVNDSLTSDIVKNIDDENIVYVKDINGGIERVSIPKNSTVIIHNSALEEVEIRKEEFSNGNLDNWDIREPLENRGSNSIKEIDTTVERVDGKTIDVYRRASTYEYEKVAVEFPYCYSILDKEYCSNIEIPNKVIKKLYLERELIYSRTDTLINPPENYIGDKYTTYIYYYKFWNSEIGGFFREIDLLKGPENSNEREILHINIDKSDNYSILIHEYQHLLFVKRSNNGFFNRDGNIRELGSTTMETLFKLSTRLKHYEYSYIGSINKLSLNKFRGNFSSYGSVMLYGEYIVATKGIDYLIDTIYNMNNYNKELYKIENIKGFYQFLFSRKEFKTNGKHTIYHRSFINLFKPYIDIEDSYRTSNSTTILKVKKPLDLILNNLKGFIMVIKRR